MNIKFISAGAGSGKTFQLTKLMSERLSQNVRPEAVIAMTFTKKAADELVERVRQRLIEDKQYIHANSMGQALIGTVNSVCGQILKRYAFEAGLSPQLEVLAEEEQPAIFAQALEHAMTQDDIKTMNVLGKRLGLFEWKKEIKKIVDLVRANDMQVDDLTSHAQQSTKDLLSNFPAVTKSDLTAQLQDAINNAINGIKGNKDETVGTKKYLDLLRNTQHRMQQNVLPWSDWVRLGNSAPTARSLPFAEPVQEIALRYDAHPDLHKDIKDWTKKLFELAAKALVNYQVFKAERGLMDYVDQEHQVLKLLDIPVVADSISQELDLLLVDEFQDTSPIQLALFLKLAECADECIWVGDIKQAIYGFRGSDPELMNAVIEKLEESDTAVEYLSSSWRSRPALVELTNELFAPAFSDYLKDNQVKLTPELKEQLDDVPLHFWNLEGRNAGLRASAMAAGIVNLLGSDAQVVDKETKKTRGLQYGDIAILSRSNDKAEAYAAALSACGLPVVLKQPGLLATPEVHLVLASLRRLVDSGDTLASAEIVSLKTTQSPEVWLESRLQYVKEADNHKQWGIEGDFQEPALVSLETIRDHLKFLSPSEVLDEVLKAVDIRRDAIAWGPTKVRSTQRLENLETLRGYSMDYEDHCQSQRVSATVGGFLLWLYALADADLDMKGGDNQANAIHVLTYHKAKGLEWPVVIAADLESGVKSSAWGLSVLTDDNGFDMNSPLANRQLRYWPWPFEGLKKGIAVAERIQEGEAGLREERKQLAEAVRLLYVGFTRARDTLILPLQVNARSRPWLETLGAGWLTPQENMLQLPNNKTIPCVTEELQAAEVTDEISVAQKQMWFSPIKSPTQKLPAHISPSGQPLVDTATIDRNIEIGPRLTLKGNPDIEVLGNALHNIIAADLIAPGNQDRREVTAGILERYSLKKAIDVDEILVYTSTFLQRLHEEFKPIKVLPEWPVILKLENGQSMHGWIDLLLETEQGYVIIDHKSFPGRRSDWESKALSYSGQLEAYRCAVQKATNLPVLSQWINFTVGGGMAEIVFSDA